MYYPYFYGREMELSAVVATSGDYGTPQRIMPVIEPALAPSGQVARYIGKLARTLTELRSAGAAAYVVVNPHQGAFEGASTVAAWAAGMSTLLGDPTVVRPAYKVRGGTTVVDVTTFVAAHQGRDLGLVVAAEHAISATQLAAAAGSANVQVFVFPEVDSAALVAAFGAARVVRVRNNFPAQARNADYLGTTLFGDNHLTHPNGFSDFTVLPSVVTFTGGRTGAAVVHLTYKMPRGEIWVAHFVSDEKDVARGTFQSKLLEALAHMNSAMTANPNQFESSPAVLNYRQQLATGRATSQGKNKELLIQHHLYLVARHLGV